MGQTAGFAAGSWIVRQPASPADRQQSITARPARPSPALFCRTLNPLAEKMRIMIAIKKVPVVTDFSDRSRLAVRRAMVICQEHGAHLEILHVIEELPPPDHLSMDQYMEKVRKQLKGEAAQAISQARSQS